MLSHLYEVQREGGCYFPLITTYHSVIINILLNFLKKIFYAVKYLASSEECTKQVLHAYQLTPMILSFSIQTKGAINTV
jgi:hypothetical protein